MLEKYWLNYPKLFQNLPALWLFCTFWKARVSPKSLKQRQFDGKHFSFEERDTHLFWAGFQNPVKISTPGHQQTLR